MQAAIPASVHPQFLAQMSTVSAGFMPPQVSSSCRICRMELCRVTFPAAATGFRVVGAQRFCPYMEISVQLGCRSMS